MYEQCTILKKIKANRTSFLNWASEISQMQSSILYHFTWLKAKTGVSSAIYIATQTDLPIDESMDPSAILSDITNTDMQISSVNTKLVNVPQKQNVSTVFKEKNTV